MRDAGGNITHPSTYPAHQPRDALGINNDAGPRLSGVFCG